ncbi:hypothetical protein VV02_18260 [Luteipulveratus mongoliensis]|uniref:Uncharacterized protein n=1 Tax=Luteipulveratus mongoliensis TaxID=571913 RepID=A0A0K1JKV1_9MICO|nr:hypothetical protein [Luteipulveratus mongoliensis]AKU17341.1 hypothetical protein VV02_18260 [Luteipulveratus mongoliensis]
MLERRVDDHSHHVGRQVDRAVDLCLDVAIEPAAPVVLPGNLRHLIPLCRREHRAELIPHSYGCRLGGAVAPGVRRPFQHVRTQPQVT